MSIDTKYLTIARRDDSIRGVFQVSHPGVLKYALTGDTWHYRDIIRKHGGVWDKWERRWFIDERGRDALVAELDAQRKEEES